MSLGNQIRTNLGISTVIDLSKNENGETAVKNWVGSISGTSVPYLLGRVYVNPDNKIGMIIKSFSTSIIGQNFSDYDSLKHSIDNIKGEKNDK